MDEGGDEEFEEDGEFDEDEEYLEDGEDGEFEEGEDDAELDAGDLATTEWVELGVVKRPQGVRGGLRMLVETDWPSQRMKAGRKLYLRPPAPTGLLARGQPPAPPPLTFTVKSASFVTSRKDGLFYCLNLREVTDMEGAQALAGHVVLIPATARQQLTDPDEFYAQVPYHRRPDAAAHRLLLVSSLRIRLRIISLRWIGTPKLATLRFSVLSPP